MKWPHATLSQTARIRVLAFVTIAVTAVISFSSLRNLAERAGFHDLAWLFPVCLDAVAALGMDLWLSNSPARRSAAVMALGAIALSTAGNIFDWSIRAKLDHIDPLWLAPALGAIPPIGLASLLLVLHRHSAKPVPPSVPTSMRHEPSGTVTEPIPTSRDLQDQPAPTSPVALEPPGMDLQPRASATRAPRRGTSAKPPRAQASATAAGPETGTRRSDAELIETIRSADAHGTPYTRRAAMSAFKVGSQKASELLAAARNGNEATS